MTEKLFEAALGIGAPWYVAVADFDAPARTLTLRVDFKAGSRFAVSDMAGEHPVHDTLTKRYRHLNFFQHECFLEVRVPHFGWGKTIGRIRRTVFRGLRRVDQQFKLTLTASNLTRLARMPLAAPLGAMA